MCRVGPVPSSCSGFVFGCVLGSVPGFVPGFVLGFFPGHVPGCSWSGGLGVFLFRPFFPLVSFLSFAFFRLVCCLRLGVRFGGLPFF